MTLTIRVKPGSKVDQLVDNAAGQLTVKIKAPAHDGKANTYLVGFLARQLDIPKSNVVIVAGFTSPFKWVGIDADEEAIQRIIAGIIAT